MLSLCSFLGMKKKKKKKPDPPRVKSPSGKRGKKKKRLGGWKPAPTPAAKGRLKKRRKKN